MRLKLPDVDGKSAPPDATSMPPENAVAFTVAGNTDEDR